MTTETELRAELSIYPLRQESLGGPIEAAVQALREEGLEPVVGVMSTAVRGDQSKLFKALERAFQAASASGDVVMTIRVSNACKG